MPGLFANLAAALEGSAFVALAAALAWGVLSVILSPCHLATIPLVVGFVGGIGPATKRSRAALVAWSFAAGMFAALAMVGVLVAKLGQALQGFRTYGSYATAVLLIAAGLYLLDLLSLPLAGLKPSTAERKGIAAALGAGLFLGIGLSPCTFAFLAPVLGVAFGAAASSVVYGAALLVAFALGHCSVVGVAGTSTAVARRFLNWNERSRGVSVLKKSCGVLLLVGASFLIYAT